MGIVHITAVVQRHAVGTAGTQEIVEQPCRSIRMDVHKTDRLAGRIWLTIKLNIKMKHFYKTYEKRYQMENFVVYICEDSEKSCTKCRQYSGHIYAEKDSRKPQLPIHPNCRCSFKRYSGNISDRNALRKFFENLPDATKAALEIKYLPTGFGEVVGVVQAASIIFTNRGWWLARARTAVRTSPLAKHNMTEILLELENANSAKDLKKIIRIYNKYK